MLSQHFTFLGPPEFTQIGFWFKNIPSGNLALEYTGEAF
jgi:hypothetical protein